MKPLIWGLILACGVPGPEVSPARERDIQEAAQRILADPVFRHFEHFPASVSQPAVEPTKRHESSDEVPNENANPPESAAPPHSGAPSSRNSDWQTLPGTKASSGSDGKPSARNQRSTAGSSDGANRPSDGAPSRGEQTASQSTAPSESTADGDVPQDPMHARTSRQKDVNDHEESPRQPASAASSAELQRPARNTRSTPSQFGSDGVERPVRFAPRKPPPQRSSDSWELPRWNLSLGFLSFFGQLFHALAYLILAAICAAIVILVARAIMTAWQDRTRAVGPLQMAVGPLADDRSPGEIAADVFLKEALALAQQGNYRAAIGRLVLGSMSFIERAQWIRFRRGLTARDYLRAVRSRPDQFAGLRTVVNVYEPVEYGRRPATEPLFATALAGYRQGFERPTT